MATDTCPNETTASLLTCVPCGISPQARRHCRPCTDLADFGGSSMGSYSDDGRDIENSRPADFRRCSGSCRPLSDREARGDCMGPARHCRRVFLLDRLSFRHIARALETVHFLLKFVVTLPRPDFSCSCPPRSLGEWRDPRHSRRLQCRRSKRRLLRQRADSRRRRALGENVAGPARRGRFSGYMAHDAQPSAAARFSGLGGWTALARRQLSSLSQFGRRQAPSACGRNGYFDGRARRVVQRLAGASNPGFGRHPSCFPAFLVGAPLSRRGAITSITPAMVAVGLEARRLVVLPTRVRLCS